MNIVRSKNAESHDVIPIKTFTSNEFNLDVWEIQLSSGLVWTKHFLSIGSTEAEAIDRLVDYCQTFFPNMIMNEDYLSELRKEAVEDGFSEETYIAEEGTSTSDGNLFLYTPYGIHIEKIT